MFKIQRLSRYHNRKGFDCGNDALNHYLNNIARQHLDKGISRTFVLIDGTAPKEILGFIRWFFPKSSLKNYLENTLKDILSGRRQQSWLGLVLPGIDKEKGSALS